ncbi:MAG TPA: 16S rRNA (guanine(527)-N(7))-methyltransferase RsmG [Rudaea sp.]
MPSAVTDRAAMFAQLRAGVAELGLAPSASAIELLLDYVELLARWNSAYNLTAVRDPLAMVTSHLLDSLAVAHLVRGERLVDVGSGAGLPGIPLAITATELQVTLIDANGKKTRFLREAVRSLALDNVRIEAQRVESVHGQFDTVIARAFASLPDMLRLAGHLLAPDGILLALKGQLHKDEIVSLPDGFVVADIEPLHVPGLAAARHAVVIQRSQAALSGHAA